MVVAPTACYRSLMRAPWFDPEASESFHDGSPGVFASLLLHD
jgi:hypothetical protein